MKKRFKNHVDIIGRGPSLLCLAGFGSSNWVFESLADRLQDRYRFILPDNRGMGRSPPAAAPYGLEALADDALAVMDDLGQDRFAVAGLSMGGFIAQLLTLRAPERVTALILLCTSSGGAEFKKIFPGLGEKQVRTLYAMPPEQRAEVALSTAIFPLFSSRYPDIHRRVLAQRRRERVDPAQVMLQYRAVTAFMERTLDLERIGCPTLILSGDTDTVVPAANAHLLGEKIPAARVEIFTDTDHLFFLEKPAELAQRVQEFLG